MADKGIVVFIADENSKRPLFGNSWYIRQTLDHDQIDSWFEETPNCNYGLHLGSEYAVIDLDFDPQSGKNGIWEFEQICAEHGIDDFSKALPTLTVRTPSGGYHLYFKVPFPVANKNKFPNGIDVRGAVGYAIGPGSCINGKEYEVLNPDAPIMDAPDWLVENYLFAPKQKDPRHDEPLIEWDLPESIHQAEEWIKHRDPAIQGHTGDDWTYETCCKLRDFGLSEAEAFRVLTESGWNQRCDPPWNAQELEIKIGNSYEYAQNRPGCASDVYKVRRMASARPSGGYAALTDEQLDELYRPKSPDPTIVAERLKWEEENGIPNVEQISNQDRNGDTSHRTFRPRSEAEQDAQPDPEWLIEGVLQKETLALFYGQENSFKSFLVLDMVLSAAARRPWASYGGRAGLGGHAADKPLTTVYIAGEGAHGIEKLRRPAWRKHHGIQEPLPFYTVNEMPFLKSVDEVERLISEIEEAEIKPDIIVIDTAARAMLDLDENSAKDTGIFIAECDRLKRHFGCTVVVIHHSGKDDKKGSRGSTNLPASFDTRYRVTGNTDTLIATIKNEKQKDGEPWSNQIILQGEKVAVRDGRTSLVFSRTTPESSNKPSKDEERVKEVRAALQILNGESNLITSRVLAYKIVERRLEKDPGIAAKAKHGDIDRIMDNERRTLQRQAKDNKKGEPGLLKQFIAGDPVGDMLWTLPADDE